MSDGQGTLGLMGLLRRVHVFGFGKVQAAGVASRWTRDLAAVGEAEVAAGELVELWSTLEGGEAVTAATKVRFDILEEDWLFTGGLDDQLVSLAGPGATAPDGFTRLDRRLVVVALGPRETAAEAVATFVGANPADFDRAILVVQDRAPEVGRPVTHVLTWWRTVREGELVTDPELYFVLDLDDARVEDGCELTLDVGDAAPGVLVRLSGRLLDDAPFAGDEPLAGVPVRLGGRTAVSGADGRFALDCRLPAGESPLMIERPGIDRRALVARVEERADGTVQLTVREDPGPFVLRQVTTAEAPTDAAPVEVPLPDVRVKVHKLRGVVTWPDSRSDAAAYRGTPLRNRRVYVLRIDGTRPTALQRPDGTAAWAALRHRPDVLRSRPAGRASEDLPTDLDGAFEVKFVDLAAGSAHLIWVEGPDPDDASRDSPEYLVRTSRRELRELHDGNAPLQAEPIFDDINRDVGRQLIDHTHNLSNDPVRWGMEVVRIVDWDPAEATTDLRAIRADPRAAAKSHLDDAPAAAALVERLTGFRPADRILEGLVLQALPLQPVLEPVDRAAPAARRARRAVRREWWTTFTRGAHEGDVRFVLDARRIDTGIDLARNPPAGQPAWVGQAGAGPQPDHVDRRRCELLEKSFLVSPDLPSATIRSVDQARWRADAITLADAARIAFPGVPNPPPAPGAARTAALNRATVANRRLLSTWVPLMRAVAPRLPGLAGSHLYLAPGHGFFPRPPDSDQADEQRSERSVGYAVEAGEDENDALMAREVDRIATRNGMRVSASRELRDLTVPGVSQPARDRWQVVPGDGFLRLWQQNPLAYLGWKRDPAVRGTFLGRLDRPAAGGALVDRDRRVDATIARVEHAARLAADPDDPIDIYLGVHTNGGEFPGGGPPVFLAVRGAEVLFVDVHSAAADLANPAEEGNTMGLGYATRLLTEIVTRCGMLNRGTRSVRANGVTNYELQQTFPHWEQNPGGGNRWQHGRLIDPTGAPAPPAWGRPPFSPPSTVGVFPRAIPVALAEIAFHTSEEECRMLREGWFRRVAGEAMAIATEDQLTVDPAPIDRGDLRTLLIGTFGTTGAIRDLPRDDAPIDGDASAAAAEAAGVAVPPNATLAGAVTAIEVARDGLTVRSVVESLTTALAARAGYPAALLDADRARVEADVARFVTGPILSGGTLATLPAPDRPATRGEINRLVAAGIGLTPIGDTRVEGYPPGAPLIAPLAVGGPGSERFLVQSDWGRCIAQIAALRPEEVYRTGEITLADHGFRRLTDLPGRPLAFVLPYGTPVRIVAPTFGAAWDLGLEDLELSISDDGCFREKLDAAVREPDWVGSVPWVLDLPDRGPGLRPYVLSLSGRHRQEGWTLVGRRWIEVEVTGRD